DGVVAERIDDPTGVDQKSVARVTRDGRLREPRSPAEGLQPDEVVCHLGIDDGQLRWRAARYPFHKDTGAVSGRYAVRNGAHDCGGPITSDEGEAAGDASGQLHALEHQRTTLRRPKFDGVLIPGDNRVGNRDARRSLRHGNSIMDWAKSAHD